MSACALLSLFHHCATYSIDVGDAPLSTNTISSPRSLLLNFVVVALSGVVVDLDEEKMCSSQLLLLLLPLLFTVVLRFLSPVRLLATTE